MNLLALDQATITTGYAIFKDNSLIQYGKFSYDDTDLDARLLKIRNKISDLITAYQIDEVIYEDIQMQTNVANNVKTFKSLAEVYGVISELFEELDIPHSSVLATTWKSSLGIKGRARDEQKRNAQKYVLDNYGQKATQDESDAICIGTYKIQQSAHDWTK